MYWKSSVGSVPVRPWRARFRSVPVNVPAQIEGVCPQIEVGRAAHTRLKSTRRPNIQRAPHGDRSGGPPFIMRLGLVGRNAALRCNRFLRAVGSEVGVGGAAASPARPQLKRVEPWFRMFFAVTSQVFAVTAHTGIVLDGTKIRLMSLENVLAC